MSKKKELYYKLGKTATSFFDPVVKLKIAGKGVGKLTLPPTRRINNALKHNHIVEATKEEYIAWGKGQDNFERIEQSAQAGKLDLSKLSSKQLVTYYEGNYEVSTDDVKAFKKMTHKEQVDFLSGSDSEEDNP